MTSVSRKISVKTAIGGLFIAAGVLLPQLFHVFGAQAGRIMLPMHVFVFASGMLLGPVYGMITGVVTPFISFLITGMPAVPQVLFMMFELAAYGLAAGLSKKLNVFLSLFVSQVSGRAVYALIMYVFSVLGVPGGGAAAVWAAMITGLPGIALQYAAVPALVVFLRKRVMSRFE